MGRILPFELVQTTHLKEEWTALRSMEKRLEQATADMDATFDELDEEERAKVTNDDGTMSIKEVERRLAELLADVETEEISALMNTCFALARKRNRISSPLIRKWIGSAWSLPRTAPMQPRR